MQSRGRRNEGLQQAWRTCFATTSEMPHLRRSKRTRLLFMLNRIIGSELTFSGLLLVVSFRGLNSRMPYVYSYAMCCQLRVYAVKTTRTTCHYLYLVITSFSPPVLEHSCLAYYLAATTCVHPPILSDGLYPALSLQLQRNSLTRISTSRLSDGAPTEAACRPSLPLCCQVCKRSLCGRLAVP